MTLQRRTVRPTKASCRRLPQLAWPLILNASCWTLQIVLDRILLSQSSIEAVGAGMSGAMMFWSVMTFFQYTANYATTFVAQYTGAGQPLCVGAVIGQALWFALLGGILFMASPPSPSRLSPWLDTKRTCRVEVIYFRLLCFAGLPMLLTTAATSFFAGRGDTRTVLFLNGIGLLVNGALASVLIFGLFGVEPMGVAGAGWATIAGTWVSAIPSITLLLRPQYVRDFGTGRGFRYDRELFARLMYFGLPQGIGVALETLAFSAFLLFVGRFGKADLAASSIACTLNLLAYLPIMGVAQAIEVLVGQHIGAGGPRRGRAALPGRG